jgi:hypothetical protein
MRQDKGVHYAQASIVKAAGQGPGGGERTSLVSRIILTTALVRHEVSGQLKRCVTYIREEASLRGHQQKYGFPFSFVRS